MRYPVLASALLFACASCMVQRPGVPDPGPGTDLATDVDLVAELAACDAVGPTDPRYPEARRRALQVEARLRESHQLLHEGLMLRSEGRDQAALHCFHGARALWPGMPGLDDWIRATEARQRLFTASVSDPITGPRADGPAMLLPDDPLTAQPAPLGEFARPVRAASEPADRLLAQVELQLREGDLDGAVATLRGADGACTREPWRRQPLFHLLRQRGLLAHGRGDLERSRADWCEALTLDPGAVDVRSWLAEAEASSRPVAGAQPAVTR